MISRYGKATFTTDADDARQLRVAFEANASTALDKIANAAKSSGLRIRNKEMDFGAGTLTMSGTAKAWDAFRATPEANEALTMF